MSKRTCCFCSNSSTPLVEEEGGMSLPSLRTLESLLVEWREVETRELMMGCGALSDGEMVRVCLGGGYGGTEEEIC